MWIALSIFLFAMWTSVFSIGKIALEYSTPFFLTAVRMLLAGGLILGYLLIRKRKSLKIKLSHLVPISLLAILSIYLTNVLEFWGMQYLSAAKTCFIYSLSPFFAALFSYLHFKEKMTAKKWLGMSIGFLGFLPVLFLQTGSENAVGGFLIFSWADLAIAGAALFSVYGWVLLRILVKNNSLSPLIANGLSMLIGGILALGHSFLIDPWTPLPIASHGMEALVTSVLAMTFISNIVAYNLYGFLLKKFTATFLSFVGLLSPIFASITGWIILGEKPSSVILFSTLVIVFGLWLVYQAELKQGYIQTKAKPEKVLS